MDTVTQPLARNTNIEFDEPPGLGSIAIVNFALAIATLGIYSFWGKTNVRKHIWQSIVLDQSRFHYHGTGGELFKGALIISFLVVLPLSLLSVATDLYLAGTPVWLFTAKGFLGLIVLYLIQVGIYRARNYRLSRTSWRGVRGAMAGSSFAYGFYALGMTLLGFLSLGLAMPWTRMKVQSRLVRETEFGDRRFGFTEQVGPLYRVAASNIAIFLVVSIAFGGISWLLIALKPATAPASPLWAFSIFVLVPLILILALRYLAREWKHFTGCTSLGGLRLDLDATTGSYIALTLKNLVIVIFTLGIAAPFAFRNVARYGVRRLTIHGDMAQEAIAQSPRDRQKYGEGLASVFDVDAF